MKKTVVYYLINARKWFDRINGNTYHTVKVTAIYNDGETETFQTPGKVYGYGNQFRETAREMIAARGLPELMYNNFTETVTESKKRDLFNF